MRIKSIKLRIQTDSDPDLSFLGKYSSIPGPGAIDRGARGDRRLGEYNYWNPTNHATFDPANWAHVPEKEKREVIRKHGSLQRAEESYRLNDYQRYEAYNNDQWYMVGIWAEVIVEVRGVNQTFRSGGLWGIESDSDRSYFEQVGKDQYRELVDILRAMGVKKVIPFSKAVRDW